ncbi:MAG: bifunctional aldolase/short-chain dehydrogenase, partial [Mesorhizobium sp.]|nr:bifunctional aldolase/short-chain dehydrogenase [Mesorhizobium sp.]
MQNLWNDGDAEALVEAYATKGVARDLALRVYTTRLLGGEPRLVLHGGGNTSSKARVTDILGDEWDVLHVKGSGWDMGVIEPQGLPAVKLEPLLKARKLSVLSDEDMVALQRANLIDPSSPNPSVETLLHAFLPHKFVDHTHSTAILAIVDQQDSEPLSRKVFGPKMAFVPYIKPGFDLAKEAADVYDRDPSVEGLILDKHGIFTFGDDAKQAYDRMIHYVTLAEDYVAEHGKPAPAPIALPATIAAAADIAPALRGAVAVRRGEGRFDRMVSDFRTSPSVLEFLARPDLADLARRGVSTPDLSIRIKTGPMVLPAPDASYIVGYRSVIDRHVAAYADDYRQYFESNNALDDVARIMLDPMPRLTLVPGLGMFGHGRTLKDAKIASDVGEMWIEAVRGAEAVGNFHPLTHAELFGLEYWSLEQAKLAANKPKPLTGQVVLVTGGAGAIGAATAKAFAAQGAHVVVVDLDEARAKEAAKAAGNNSMGVGADVTDPAQVGAAFDAAVATYG